MIQDYICHRKTDDTHYTRAHFEIRLYNIHEQRAIVCRENAFEYCRK